MARLALAVRIGVRPRWLAGLAVAVAFAVMCGLLAQWQWHRRTTAEARNDLVAANYDRPPAPLAPLLSTGGSGLPEVTPGSQWRPVRLAGTYDDGSTVLVRNRPLDGRTGYLVATPLRLTTPVAGAGTIWVVRGWTSGEGDADPVVPPAAADPSVDPSTGRADVVARLRVPEPSVDRVAPPGQAYRLSPGDLARATPGQDPGPVVDGFAVAEVAPDGLQALGPPEPDPSPHLAYTVQWWLFAAAGFAIWGVYVWRVAGESQGPAAPVPAPAASRPARRQDPWRYEPGG